MERHLIIGLGNPGPEYARTRHNIGFMAIDRLAARYQIEVKNKKFNGLVGQGTLGAHEVVLLKPLTYMNLSGHSAQPAAAFYKVPVTRVIVLHDELDLAPGVMRLKQAGGHGGHNGLRDLIKRFGAPDFARVRLGIGRPEVGEVTGYVLGAFSKAEEPGCEAMIEDACDAIALMLDEGIVAAQNRFHAGAK